MNDFIESRQLPLKNTISFQNVQQQFLFGGS